MDPINGKEEQPTPTPTPTWEELLGSNNWEGLLDPLHPALRGFIIGCGNFSEATYDTFNSEEYSKWCGSSRHGKKDFFKKVKLDPPCTEKDFQVESFLYATLGPNSGTPGDAADHHHDLPSNIIVLSKAPDPWDRHSNWMGYIAVTTDKVSRAIGRREIYVAWRGTVLGSEWKEVDTKVQLESAKPLFQPPKQKLGWPWDKEPKVMRGFLKLYSSKDPDSAFTCRSARKQLNEKMKEIFDKYKGEKLSVVVTGHSLGGALSVISAFDLVENMGIINLDIPVATIIFGTPQLGNELFNKELQKHPNLKVLHIKNTLDWVPSLPGKILGYADITGVTLEIDSRKSPFLKELPFFPTKESMSKCHSLEATLHIVAGWNGAKGEFHLQVKRCLALVNKYLDFLKDEYLIPGSWSIEKDKDLVRNEETGEWVVATPAPDDIPVPEHFPITT